MRYLLTLIASRWSAAAAILLCSIITASVAAQSSRPGLERTWNGPDLALIKKILADDDSKKATSGAQPKAVAAAGGVKFTPGRDSGVPVLLSGVFGRTAEEKASLKEAFEQIRDGFNAEMVKERRTNDLAAAMTFFLVANVAAYHKAEVSDPASEDLYRSIAATMSSIPAIKSMTDAEKHQMHDWLVCMGGFALSVHQQSQAAGDKEGLAQAAEFAALSTKIVLGVDLAKMSGGRNGIRLESGAAASAPVSASPVLGIWTAAAASPVSTNLITNAGSVRMMYDFRRDGTYIFKSERWGGYLSNNWWTTEESGTYTVSGATLTVSPRTSKLTMRNSDGVVKQTKNNPLEKVAYKWTTHYFEGIQETNLVLEPPQKTDRDGVMGGSSLFPRAYLYKQGDNLSWRY